MKERKEEEVEEEGSKEEGLLEREVEIFLLCDRPTRWREIKQGQTVEKEKRCICDLCE